MPAKKGIPKLFCLASIANAIGFNPAAVDKPLFCRSRIDAHFGDEIVTLRRGYSWDGATISRFWQWVLGITPTDPRVVLASGFHDEGCENPLTPQAVADANFVALLGALEFNNVRLEGLPRWKQLACYVAVRFYSLCVRPTTRLFFRKG